MPWLLSCHWEWLFNPGGIHPVPQTTFVFQRWTLHNPEREHPVIAWKTTLICFDSFYCRTSSLGGSLRTCVSARRKTFIKALVDFGLTLWSKTPYCASTPIDGVAHEVRWQKAHWSLLFNSDPYFLYFIPLPCHLMFPGNKDETLVPSLSRSPVFSPQVSGNQQGAELKRTFSCELFHFYFHGFSSRLPHYSSRLIFSVNCCTRFKSLLCTDLNHIQYRYLFPLPPPPSDEQSSLLAAIHAGYLPEPSGTLLKMGEALKAQTLPMLNKNTSAKSILASLCGRPGGWKAENEATKIPQRRTKGCIQTLQHVGLTHAGLFIKEQIPYFGRGTFLT